MSDEIIYVCKLGGEVPKSGTYRWRSRVNHITRILCRKHKKPIVSRKKKCNDCGEWFTLKPMGPGGFRCPECARAVATLRRAGYNPVKKPQVKKNKNWSFDKRGDYCRLLPECMDRGEYECKGCQEFVGVFPRVDPEVWLVPGVRLCI